MLELSSRLKTVSEFVRHNSRVADIGTDHAFLPVYLIQNNIAKSSLHVIYARALFLTRKRQLINMD